MEIKMTDRLYETILEAIDAVHDMDVTHADYAREAAKRVRAMVPELKWHRSHKSSWNGDYHTVPNGYMVRCADENGWVWYVFGGKCYAHSPEAAKAAEHLVPNVAA